MRLSEGCQLSVQLLAFQLGFLSPIALHAAYNSIIQSAFAPATTGAGAQLWVGMEAGILVVLTTVVAAVVFSRGHWTILRAPEAREAAGAPIPAPRT